MTTSAVASSVDRAPALQNAEPNGASGWRRRATRILVAVAVVAALAFGVTRYRAGTKLPPLRYETAPVDQGPLDARVTASGALSPLVLVQVGSQVSGRLTQLDVDFGSVVKRGQTVARIDPSLFRAAVSQARANHTAARASVERARAELLQAQRQYARDKVLASQGLVAQAEYDVAESNAGVAAANVRAAEATVAQARAALDQAELNLTYTTIASPIDGIVISRNVDVGQTVAAALQAPGTPGSSQARRLRLGSSSAPPKRTESLRSSCVTTERASIWRSQTSSSRPSSDCTRQASSQVLASVSRPFKGSFTGTVGAFGRTQS